jgi:hypothetical protein
MITHLPIHDLPMDQPLPSQERDYSFGKGYCWIMTATERAHIAQMLMVDSMYINTKVLHQENLSLTRTLYSLRTLDSRQYHAAR